MTDGAPGTQEGVNWVGRSDQPRVNCHASDQPPLFGVLLASRARTRQKYEPLSSVVGGEYRVPLIDTSRVMLLAQSPFGLTCSSYVFAPETGSQEKTTSVTAANVVFVGVRSVGTDGHA